MKTGRPGGVPDTRSHSSVSGGGRELREKGHRPVVHPRSRLLRFKPFEGCGQCRPIRRAHARLRHGEEDGDPGRGSLAGRPVSDLLVMQPAFDGLIDAFHVADEGELGAHALPGGGYVVLGRRCHYSMSGVPHVLEARLKTVM